VHVDRHPGSEPAAGRLAGRAGQLEADRVLGQPLGAAGADESVRDAAADREEGWLPAAAGVRLLRETSTGLAGESKALGDAGSGANAELEDMALGFVEEWIWYDEEEASIERARYAGYGFPVRGANLRSEKLALLRGSGMRHSSLDEVGRTAREALERQWLKNT